VIINQNPPFLCHIGIHTNIQIQQIIKLRTLCQLLYLNIIQTALPEVYMFYMHTGRLDHIFIHNLPPLRINPWVTTQIQLF